LCKFHVPRKHNLSLPINISWTIAGLTSPEGGNVTKANFKIGVSERVPRRMTSALICTRWHAWLSAYLLLSQMANIHSLKFSHNPTQILSSMHERLVYFRKNADRLLLQVFNDQKEHDGLGINYLHSWNLKHPLHVSFAFTKLYSIKCNLQ